MKHVKQNGDYNSRRNQASPIPQSVDNRQHPASPRQHSEDNRRIPASPRRPSGDNRRNPTSPNLQLAVDDRQASPVQPEGDLLNLFSKAHKRFSKESEVSFRNMAIKQGRAQGVANFMVDIVLLATL